MNPTSMPSTPLVKVRLGQTTCLLCHFPVSINPKKTVSSLEDLERRKWVQTLCSYRRIQLVIPERCSETMFPFCEDCKQRLEQLSFHWENLEKTFNGIEKEVVDGAIKRMPGKNSGMLLTDEGLEAQKCNVLRNLLLQGYRSKVLANQHQRLTMQLQMNGSSPIPSSSGSVSDLHRVHISSSTCTSSNMVPNLIDLNCEDADTRLVTEWGNEKISDSVDDNDNGSVLRISNIPTTACDAEMDRGRTTDVTVRGPKQKIGGKNSDQNDQVGPGKSDDNDEILGLAGTHRQNQIEIFPMVGNGANATHDSLQCGEPNLNLITATCNIVPTGQFVGEPHTCDDLPSKKKAAASQARPRALSPLVREGTKRIFMCYDCRKLFPNELALVKHAKRHAKRGSYAKKRSVEKSGVKRKNRA